MTSATLKIENKNIKWTNTAGGTDENICWDQGKNDGIFVFETPNVIQVGSSSLVLKK